MFPINFQNIYIYIYIDKMLENAARWPGNAGSRLVKAKSSPNVSKAPLSVPRQKQMMNPPDQSSRSTLASKSPRVVKTVPPVRTSSKIVSNDYATIRPGFSVESTKTRVTCPSNKLRGRSTPDSGVESTRCTSNQKIIRNEKRHVTRSISSSCTILEDRALLKKGLSYVPGKLPKKPEALRKKATLDRSVSLGCVSVDARNGGEESFRMNGAYDCESSRRMTMEKKQDIPRRKSINRSASLWSVQASNRNDVPGRKPSKIPLLAHRNIRVGRSLADLSQVDRAVEPTMQPVPFDDVDLDRSMDERIYENCREAFSCASIENRQPARAYTSNLEERVARLMAQLDDDVDDDEHARATMVASTDCVDAAPPRRTNPVYEAQEIDVKRNDESDRKIGHQRYTSTVIRIEESSERREESTRKVQINEKKSSNSAEVKNMTMNSAKELRSRMEYEKVERQEYVIEESKKKKETSNIQELRKNWEKQVVKDTERKIDHVSDASSNAEQVKSSCQRNNEIKQEAKSKQSVGKRAKEIEHLVNFFNCKNAEASKEVKDPWIKARSTTDAATIEPSMTTLKKSIDVKNIHDYNGYTSDGNCSEDSGHMSNENEIEWKEGVQSVTRDFGKEPFFERNELREIGVYDATSIVTRLEPEKKPSVVVRGSVSTSSGASSIDSCKGENAKVGEQTGKDQWKACRSYNDERQVRRLIIGLLDPLDTCRE